VPAPVSEQHEFFGKDQGLRIRDLVFPTKKMSKSDDTVNGVVFLNDSPEVGHRKIMTATTDSYSEINYDLERQPGISNLLQLLALLTYKNLDEVINTYSKKKTYGPLKAIVADEVVKLLTNIQTKRAEINTETILAKLAGSEEKMRMQANTVLNNVQVAVGLRNN